MLAALEGWVAGWGVGAVLVAELVRPESRGRPLGVVYREELAADGVSEFGFVCLPLKFRGGTGSPVRPIALV